MFNFMKKGAEKDEKEKEKRKKEKKEKKRERGSMTAEELLRLDEVRRSLKIRGRRKEKEKLPSGITADYSENFFADLERDPEFLTNRSGSLPGHTLRKSMEGSPKNCEVSQSDSSETSLNSLNNSSQAPNKVLPPLPPRPPKRGILKGPRPPTSSLDAYDNHDPISPSLLLRNTLQNEVIAYQNVLTKSDGFINNEIHCNNVYSSPEHSTSHSGSHYLTAPIDKNHVGLQSTSPSAESLTDTNSSFATPPYSLSPVGESQGFIGVHTNITNKSNLPIPTILPVKLAKPRDLVIYRTQRGDFGFSLRRAIITDKLATYGKESKAVIFAEPGAILPNNNETSLIPGDALLEVNGQPVHEKSREEIIDLIKSSGAKVTVKVQPIPELSELTRRSGIDGQEVHLDDSHIKGGTLRRSGSQRFKKPGAKSDEQLAVEKSWLDADWLWLVHRNGYSAVKIVSNTNQSESGKLKVKLEETDEILEVDEDDLERANPQQLDKIEDLSQLRYLNESSLLDVLRQRYGNNLIHTYLGDSLAIINPQSTLSVYNDKVISLFRGCKLEDMPPHVYSTAQATYRAMLSTRKDQSIVFLGRSGSGKTVNVKHTMYYLLLAAGTVNKVLTVEKLNALNTVLESFGNARTHLNLNATRSTNMISFDFDQSGQIASLSVQMLMLEKQRVTRRVDGEGTFHVFHRLLAGAESSLAKQLSLDSISLTSNLFVEPFQKGDDKQKISLEFSRLSLALKALGASDKECHVLWSVLAAILHLGQAGAVQVGTNKWQFADLVCSTRACKLIGTTSEDLAHVLWDVDPTSSPTTVHNNVTGPQALEGFVVGLYTEIINVVTSIINRCLTTNVHTTSSIILLDCPGLQNPATCGQHSGASYSDLFHNYLQERLHLYCYNQCVVSVTDRYTQERVDVNLEEANSELTTSPVNLVNLLDKTPPSGVLKTSQTDLREVDKRGMLWMLEEEGVYPNSSDDTFLERVFSHYGNRDHQKLIRKAPGSSQFVLQHLQGTSPVVYCVQGWVKSTKENPMSRTAITVLQESTKENVSELFITGRGGLNSSVDGSQSLRRMSSIRRTCSVAVSRKSLGLQVKFTTDGVIETLRRTKSRFVFCLLAHHNAGLTDTPPCDSIMNIPLLRSQVRGAQLLSLVRVHKQGFPDFVPHGEFRRRFRLLSPETADVTDDQRAVEDMLVHMDVDYTSYRVGVTQVFLRSGVLTQLESQRDEKLSDVVVQFQSSCRGYLARKKLAKLKIQDLAVRCIQRNVRKFMKVRDWPWWRLLIRITPLLNVHRTEEQLTAKTQELDSLKTRLERLEQERNQLKLENDKLETKLSEMTVDLSEERAGATVASERLEAETSERIRLEQELSQLQFEKKNLQQATERLEMELLYARTDMNGLSERELDGEDGSGDASVYKQKCERAMRELEFTRRRLQQQHEDDLEQLVGLKKQLEKKLADAYEEVEEQRQVVTQWKRKVQKLQQETNDLRLMLEEQCSRNNLLEKKQRKFDSEVQMLQDELRSEKNQRERCSREREIAVAEKYSLEQTLSSVRLELELKEEKVTSLTRELEDLTRGGGTEQDITNLRKSKHDLEVKLKEQEEELDELAGQVSMLEGTKLRLEMSLEQARKEHKRELAMRDEELDEARANSVKKMKGLECQLETEHEERTVLMREKHELERRLTEAEDKGRHSRAADEETFLRLKRDLKKTKALLRDSQVMLDRAKQDSPGKAAFRALKNQLEDAELARSSAVKAKQVLESEVSDLSSQLEEATRTKYDAESKAQASVREANGLRTQLDENEEELAELLKKYRQTIHQLSAEQLSHQEMAGTLAEVESERNSLREQLAELSAKLEASTTFDPTSGIAQRRLEVRTKELEAKLDLEQTTRGRMEVQITRLKENVEKLTEEAIHCRTKEQAASDQSRKLQRSLREVKEELTQQQTREQESAHRRKDLEKRLETAEQEAMSARTDLRLALKRIEDLQSAISGELASDSEHSDSDGDSDSGDDSLMSHLTTPSRLTSRTPDFSSR